MMPATLPIRALTKTSVMTAMAAAAGVLAAAPAHADDERHLRLLPEADRLALQAEAPPRFFDLLPEADRVVAPLAVEDDADADAGDADEAVVHVVAAGESLADIAAAHGLEGIDAWRRLFDANPHLDDPDLVEPGDEVRIPAPDEELEARELPAVSTTAPAASTGATTAGGDVWDRLAQCEATGNWAANTGNGYYGGLQFHPQTWAAHGGHEFASSAHQATRAQQITVAERVLATQGWGAWPACSRRLGLR